MLGNVEKSGLAGIRLLSSREGAGAWSLLGRHYRVSSDPRFSLTLRKSIAQLGRPPGNVSLLATAAARGAVAARHGRSHWRPASRSPARLYDPERAASLSARMSLYIARLRPARPNAVGLGSSGGAGHDHHGFVWRLGRLGPVAMAVALEREVAHLALDHPREAAQPAWGQQVSQHLSDRLAHRLGQPPRGKTPPGWSPGAARCAGCE